MAYDSTRQRVVLFGGLSGSARNDTWEWDGTNWEQRTPATSPSARYQHCLAYDAARRRVVLFGGSNGGAETWEWTGTNWLRIAVAASPPARWTHALAYDAALRQVLLFGGYDGVRRSDTWEWNGVVWAQRGFASRPSARNGHAVAYDSARRCTVLFGGSDGGENGETWELGLADLGLEYSVAAVPGNPTSVAAGATATFSFVVGVSAVATTGAVVVDGAIVGAGVSSSQLTSDAGCETTDGWQVTLPGPVSRIGAVTADEDLVFQGQRDLRVSMTVSNSGTTSGTILSATPTFARAVPVDSEFDATPDVANPVSISARETVRLTFTVAVSAFATTGTVTVGGSISGSGTQLGTVDSDADTTDSWTVGRPARISIGAVATSHETVRQGQRGLLVDLTVTNTGDEAASVTSAGLTLATSLRWIRRYPTSAPAARHYHAMAYDASRRRTVLFGGHAFGLAGETWEWNGTDWVQMTPTSRPSDRSMHAMAYDAARQRAVLFGGSFGGDETWEWNGIDWVLKTPASSPPARSCHAMAYDAERQRVVLFGGVIGAVSLDDTWEWDGTTWARAATSTRPSARYQHSMAYDATRRRVVLFGGTTGFAETWEWDGIDWFRKHPTRSPLGRRTHDLVYNSALERMILFGGYSGVRLDDTWVWDGTDWLEQSPVSRPAARNGHAMAYDPTRKCAVLFGGAVGGDPSSESGETWELEARDLISEYRVALPSIPTSVAPGATATLTFVVAVSATATTTTVNLDGFVEGVGAVSRQPTRDSGSDALDHWTVEPGLPAFEIVTVTAGAGHASQGQRGLSVSMTVANTGTLPGTVTTAELTFGNGDELGAEYTVTPSGGNPPSVAAGDLATFAFTVDISPTATPGTVVMDGRISGRGANGNTFDAGAGTIDSWVVQTPARLAIESVSALPVVVSRGQTGIAVTMVVTNTGQATAIVGSTGLTFSNEGDDTGAYAVVSGANPGTIAGGATATFGYAVTVGTSARLGLTALNGTVSGTDANSGAPITDTSADEPDSWTVQAPAVLSIVSVRTTPTQVSRGQASLAVAMVVTNTGQASANIGSTGLTFSNGGDDTGAYAVVSGANPGTIAGGVTATFGYTVTVGTSARLGVTALNGAVSGTDANSGAQTTDTSADTADDWTVQTQAALAIGMLAAPDGVYQGQSFGCSVTVTNTGEAPAHAATAGLTFEGVGIQVSPSQETPVTIDGGSSKSFSFQCSVSVDASPGPRTATLTLFARDGNSEADIGDAKPLAPPLAVLRAPRVQLSLAPGPNLVSLPFQPLTSTMAGPRQQDWMAGSSPSVRPTMAVPRQQDWMAAFSPSVRPTMAGLRQQDWMAAFSPSVRPEERSAEADKHSSVSRARLEGRTEGAAIRSEPAPFDVSELARRTGAVAVVSLASDSGGPQRFATYLPAMSQTYALEGELGYVVLVNSPRRIDLVGRPWPEAAKLRLLRPRHAIIGPPSSESATGTLEDLRVRAGADFVVWTREGANRTSHFSVHVAGQTTSPPVQAGHGYLLDIALPVTLQW
ncbi:MAG: hypothetical protein HY814_03170 [Candidatus Riflebacteria bacterium]|nr:hypothetical protein [Candidatus Riflebacteria bacterium]